MKGTPWPELLAGGFATALVATLAWAVRAILTGGIVARSVLQDEKERADKWEAAWREERARVDALEGRLTAIAEGTELNTQLLSSLMDRASRR
ncbi:hypothetical protein ACQEU3_46715 [Spirillospora sp. CA-253888]